MYGLFQKQRCSHKIAEVVFGYAANVVFNSMIFHEALLIIIFLFVLLLTGIIKRAIYRDVDNISFKSALFHLFSIISIASIFYICYSDEFQYQIAFGISFGTVVMNFFFLSLLHELTKKNEIIKEKEMVAVQSKDQLMMYSNIIENYEKHRRLNHEHKNHLFCLQALIANGKYAEAVRYIEDISDTYTHNEETNIIDTNHIMVNSVINVKYREALSRQILLLLKVNDLSGIIVSDADIVVLISNLLDNAIEAATKVKNKKIIRVKLMNEPDALIISVENTFDNILIRDDDIFETTKSTEVDLHGLGIKNIIGVINKYHGRYIIEEKGNIFRFSIMI